MKNKARTKGERRRDRHRREPYAPPVPDFTAPREDRAKPPITLLGTLAALRYERREARMGVRHYVRRHSTLLDVLAANSVITRQMGEAGKRFCEDYARVWGSGSRDSTIPPIGGQSHESAAEAERTIRARSRLASVQLAAGPFAYSLLRRICVDEHPLGRRRGANVLRYRKLAAGLVVCASVYGVPE
jgi:hypothetical protein